MKSSIKSLLRKVGRGLLSPDLFSHYPIDLLKEQTDAKATQVLLQQHYRSLARQSDATLPTFREVGFRQYSQFEEDGILLFLFSLIPPVSRACVEICAGDGIECNTANLIINHGWWGHLFDGRPENVRKGTAFYAKHRDTFAHPPSFHCGWVTAENVNQLIIDSGAPRNIDMLSLDMDGVDYWVWKAIEVVDPLVVVCETQSIIPPDLALTVPYNPKFYVESLADEFRGASLRAMVNLGREKGYRLVGTHRYGFNAFFVKNGVVENLLPEVTPESCAADPYTLRAQQTRWPGVSNKNWTRV